MSGKLFEMFAHDILRKVGKFKYRQEIADDDNYETLELQKLEYKQIRDINEI